METTLEPVGIREAKNQFSALTARVNETGTPLTVFKNSKPWVVIIPADSRERERRARLDRLRKLTASIERDVAAEPSWDASVSDRDLLDDERVRRFG